MENILRLSYVNECLIMGYSSEAQEELGKIINALRSNKNYEITNGNLIADQLETTLSKLHGGIEVYDAYRRSASKLIWLPGNSGSGSWTVIKRNQSGGYSH